MQFLWATMVIAYSLNVGNTTNALVPHNCELANWESAGMYCSSPRLGAVA